MAKILTLKFVNQYSKMKKICPWAQGIIRLRDGGMCAFESVQDFERYISHQNSYDRVLDRKQLRALGVRAVRSAETVDALI